MGPVADREGREATRERVEEIGCRESDRTKGWGLAGGWLVGRSVGRTYRIRVHAPGGGVGRGRRGSRSALTYCSTFVRRAHSSLSELRRDRRGSGRARSGRGWGMGSAGADEETGEEPQKPRTLPLHPLPSPPLPP